MRNFVIVGGAKIAGRNPGETISEADLPNINIEALVTSGHLAIAKPSKEKKNNGEASVAVPGDHDQCGGPD